MPFDRRSDSDDDELFFQGGRKMATSVYTLTNDTVVSSDDDDDEEKLIFETPAKRPRGRPRKISTPVQLPPQEKKPKTSVFEISSDDEPEIVQVQETDEHDRTVNQTLALARAVIAQGDEDALAREAEEEAQRERALRERQEALKRYELTQEKRLREEAVEKARKEKEARQARAAAAAKGDVEPSQDPDAIQFQVRMDESRKIRIRIRRTDPLMKMLPPFCKRFGLLTKDVVMRVDGEDVGDKDTPETMDCDDGMQVDVAMRKR